MRKKLTGMVLILGLMALGSTAQAVPITGGALFSGVTTLSPGSIATADTVTFALSGFLGGDGDYAGVTPFTVVTFNTLQISPFVPLTPLWTFTDGLRTYSFNLLTLTTVLRTGGVLSLRGTGMSSITGLDDTEMAFSFTTQTPALGTGIFSFSASTSTEPVPEPGTLLLIGTGLTGLALRRRRRA